MDDILLVRDRYKVVQVLDTREDYAFAEAVDILDRQQGACLLNIYEGPLLRAYLPCFDQMRGCPAFQTMFLEGDSLVTVFEERTGRPIDQVFFRGDSHDWRERLEYAELLLHAALNMADLPPEVSCAAMLSENVLVCLNDKEIRLQFKVLPLEGMNSRELVYLAGDHLKKILLPRFSTPREQLDFLDEVEEGGCVNIVRLYALWRERRGTIQAAYEALEEMNFIRRWLSLLWGRIKRKMARRGEKR